MTKRGHEHPCFDDEYEGYHNVRECVWHTENEADCLFVQRGGSWWDCASGYRNWDYPKYKEWQDESGPDMGEWEELLDLLRKYIQEHDVDAVGPPEDDGMCHCDLCAKAREILPPRKEEKS